MYEKDLPVWELLAKKMTWEQLDNIKDRRVLDYGSGNGCTASHFAAENDVTAIEPDEVMLRDRVTENAYRQIKGGLEALDAFEDGAFDAVLCHNVLEYAADREKIVRAFARILKKGGVLSVVKHNRAGRVMQMVVLLNNFDHALELLEGKDGRARQFGAIRYYGDADIPEWSGGAFRVEKIHGMRAFWCLQQNQEVQREEAWQEKMLSIERKVSDIDDYRAIAFFHHLILRKI